MFSTDKPQKTSVSVRCSKNAVASRYVNDRNKRCIEVVPDMAKLVREAFLRYATGNYPIHEVRKQMNALGLRSCAGALMSTSNYQSMLTNPFYYGVMNFQGELYEGKHEPIIAKALFDKVQEVMKRKGKLEAFEQARANRFEPSLAFVNEAKNAAFLLVEKNRDKNRDFLRKLGSNLHVAEQALKVEFKNPWKLVADFNSSATTTLAACGENQANDLWRRGRDSNPRDACASNGFQDRRFQPLSHLSIRYL